MSLRNAISQMCKSCIYDPEVEGGWIQQVSLCDLSACSLWEHRPHPRTAPLSLKKTSSSCHFEVISNEQGVWV